MQRNCGLNNAGKVNASANIYFCLIGIVEFFFIRTEVSPVATSTPRERGTTSRRNMSLIRLHYSPVIIAAWIAAPAATASSGFM